MTIDLFAASFICRHAEPESVVGLAGTGSAWLNGWIKARAVAHAVLAGLVGRRSPAS